MISQKQNFLFQDESLVASSRRNFLTTGGLVLGGLMCSTLDLEAARRPAVDLDSLPREWVRREGGEIKAYAKYVQRLKLRNISTHEVVQVHSRRKGSVWNEIPPRRYWKNMKATLKAADKLADYVGRPVKHVVSAYRSPAYNARCPGAKPKSFHKTNVALDLQFSASPWRVYKTARYLRDNKKMFKGGIGSYRSFTHIDTRGYNATW